MNLKHLTDHQLNSDLRKLVAEERALLTTILYHLKEVEHRKLFVEYKCSSLFDYACKELKYSSDQAYRRIQAMRLLKHIPEVAPKINSGELSLSNINQAQRFFNENKISTKPEKLLVLKKLVNKSVRDGQKEILKLSPQKSLPQETQKQVSPTHTHVSFNMSVHLEQKLENIKSLLGPKAYNMSTSELVETLADLATEKLQEKKFGKKRSTKGVVSHQQFVVSDLTTHDAESTFHKTSSISCTKTVLPTLNVQGDLQHSTFHYKDHLNKFRPEQNKSPQTLNHGSRHSSNDYTGVPKTLSVSTGSFEDLPSTTSKNPRYVSQKLKHYVWHRDKAQCTHCNSKTNLHLDHIKPVALGGQTHAHNLRLLCFHCNQRHRINMKLGGIKSLNPNG